VEWGFLERKYYLLDGRVYVIRLPPKNHLYIIINTLFMCLTKRSYFITSHHIAKPKGVRHTGVLHNRIHI
jgi:hypothetical protein